MRANAPSNVRTYGALYSGDFRLYMVGQLISMSGTWMQTLAQGYLVFQITRSEAWLGIVACAAGLPFLLLAPIGGVIVDQVPRRRLLLVTMLFQMGLAFILAALTFAGVVQVWHILVLAFLLGTSNALDMPARQTFVIEVVGADQMHSGIALNSVLNSASRILGPMAAGIALIRLGPAWCFFINGLSFVAAIAMLLLMHVPYAFHSERVSKPLEQLRQGLQFARHHPMIAPLLLLSTISSVSLVPIMQIMPAYADTVLGSPDAGYAALSIAQGAGSVIAGVLAGWLAKRFGYGRLLVTCAFAVALCTALLTVQRTIPPAVAINVLWGAFMMLLYVCINIGIQVVVPNGYRSRIMALYTLTFMGIAPFSSLLLGFIASAIGTPGAMLLSAVLGASLSAFVFVRWSRVVTDI